MLAQQAQGPEFNSSTTHTQKNPGWRERMREGAREGGRQGGREEGKLQKVKIN
jgi:hypothetical protein